MSSPQRPSGASPGLFARPPAQQAHRLFEQAVAMHQRAELPQALALYEQVIHQWPKHFDALNLAGVLALQLGRASDAVAWLNRAVKIERSHAGAYNNRGAAYQHLGELDLALLNFNKAIELDSRSAKAYGNRGNVLSKLNRLDEALRDFDQAIALEPDDFAAHNNRGILLGDMTRYQEGRMAFERAIVLSPQSVDAHWNLGMNCLRMGDFETGWRESEWRLQRPACLGLQNAHLAPRWTGHESLDGKTILLCHEQGLGDTIQFSRYARLVLELGARVVLQVQPELLPLLRSQPDMAVVCAEDALPPIDFYCPLLSLPMLFKTTLSNMPPPTAMLRPGPDKMAQWTARLGVRSKPRVGMVWSGNPAHVDDVKRSIPPADLADWFTSDIEWVNLNKDGRAADRGLLDAHPEIAHFGEHQHDFADTAALCELMDAVVSVDTSVAHLAASLGKATAVLHARNPDWRWLVERDDSPWYPSATLYRQERLRDWAGVLPQVRRDLNRRLGLPDSGGLTAA